MSAPGGAPGRRRFGGLLLALATAACARTETMDIVPALERATSALKPGEVLAFDAAAPFAWDQLLLAGPYTPNSELERVLGMPVPAALRAVEIDRRDDANAVVFLAGGKAVHAQAIPRRIMDFRKPDLLRRIPRAEARFRRGESGVVYALVAG